MRPLSLGCALAFVLGHAAILPGAAIDDPPLGHTIVGSGRGAQHALHYLGRYTHRVAISNHRLVSLADGHVTFRYRDSAHRNQQRRMTLTIEEFLRRFLLHILPPGFVRIRYFGFFAHRHRRLLVPLCFRWLAVSIAPARQKRETASPLWQCPHCGGAMVLRETLSPVQARLRSPPLSSSPRL